MSSNSLTVLGANSAPLVRVGQVYRLLSAIFLHVYFMHIFSNILVTFMFLSRVEHTFGWWRTLIIYILSGISGNIFSILCSPDGMKAGASTSLYGIMGLILGYIIINWSGFNMIGPALKCQVICTGMMVLVFTFVFTPTVNNVDYFGHLGGFLGGLWLSCLG